MTKAFVLSGGAALGSIQVGMAAALAEADISPDIVVGSSVGALNGAWLASGRPVDGLADVWRGIKRQDLFPVRPFTSVLGLLGRGDHLVPDSGLKRLLNKYFRGQRLESGPIPLTVIATEVASGSEVALAEGPLVPAVMASAALPGIFPIVDIDGRQLFDGGVANNTPITRAIEAGADEVWVLSTGYSCGLIQPPKGALALAMHSAGLLVQQRLVLETVRRNYPVPVHLIPPPCPIDVSPIDFSQSDDLMQRALLGTRQWLGNGCPNAMPLIDHAVHAHAAHARSGD